MFRSLKVITLILLISLPLMGCSNGIDSTASAEKVVKEYLGNDVIIIQPNNLSILSIDIVKPLSVTGESTDGLYRVNISYGLEHGELIELTDQQRYEIEKNQGNQLLYGVYSGKVYVHLEITNGTTVIDDLEANFPERIRVQNSMDGDRFISTVLTNDDLSYYLTFNIDDNFTEEDAMEFTGYLIDEFK